jgi:hypothetical protein
MGLRLYLGFLLFACRFCENGHQISLFCDAPPPNATQDYGEGLKLSLGLSLHDDAREILDNAELCLKFDYKSHSMCMDMPPVVRDEPGRLMLNSLVLREVRSGSHSFSVWLRQTGSHEQLSAPHSVPFTITEPSVKFIADKSNLVKCDPGLLHVELEVYTFSHCA